MNKIINKIINNQHPVVCWFSGGVTSAVACKLTLDLFGINNCRIIFIDTKNEHESTYTFMYDCEKWYNKQIETISSDKYNDISEVWKKFLSLNVATGAICSTELKRAVREKFQKDNKYSFQIFGFDTTESKRIISMSMNYSNISPIFPLALYGYTKIDCIKILQKANIEIPETYKFGFHNNNCFKRGCVQGGIGYWQKMKIDFPLKFDEMANMEHELTDIKGIPVTMLKDQSKKGGLVFLKPHPKYPYIKDISMMKGREVKPLLECNGFCGINDLLIRNITEKEINYCNE